MQQTNPNTFRDLRTAAAITGILLLGFHFYYYCYQALAAAGIAHPIVDRFVLGLAHAGLFRHRALSKGLSLLLLVGTTIGTPTPTQIKSRRRLFFALLAGSGLYFGSDLVLMAEAAPATLALLYIGTTLAGLLLSYSGIKALIGLITWPHSAVFNAYNESFPQEERLIKAPQSIHLKAQYNFRHQKRNSIINLSQIYRGTLVMGSAGSGKTRYVFRQLIQQSLANSMCLFVYDLKYDDLTRLTWNTFQREKHRFPVTPQFYSVNFDDFSKSHRCNPLDPASLDDIADAAECARTILLALNKRFIQLQGDFFVESAIAFFTANIWFLKLYEDGRYCTLAHLIELLQTDFAKLFSILRSEPTVETQISPFVSAYLHGSIEQLQGQVDSARIALSTLASPHLYYLISANEFTLDINNPQAPKIVCVGSNAQKQHVYGAVVSLYMTRMLKLVNRKGGLPCHLLYDEFTSCFPYGIDLALAQARSNKVAITLGIQTIEQLRAVYGRDHADTLFNLPANLICSQVSGDSARLVSERFGKILQEKNTVSTNSRDSSTSQTQQLDLAMPASKIATLSSGEFVGITADSPSQPMALKAFHSHILIDDKAIEQEEAAWQPLPEIRTVTPEIIDYNFRLIKQQVRTLVDARLAFMAKTPALASLIIQKKGGPGKQRRQTP